MLFSRTTSYFAPSAIIGNTMKWMLSLLLAQNAMFLQAATTLRMDNKTIFVPETKLIRKVNPVIAILYLGSWEGGPKEKNAKESLCQIDLENNEILIRSPERLLDNSKTRLVTRSNMNAFLDEISWDRQQATHIAFKVISNKRQSAVIKACTDSDLVWFCNGKLGGHVSTESALAAGGFAYLPITLEAGANIINIKQFSSGGKPRVEATIFLDHSHDLKAAWQSQGGLLKKLLHSDEGRDSIPMLEWIPDLGNFSVSLEVRDASTGNIVLQRESVRRGRLSNDKDISLSPGIYEAIYRNKGETASEFFIIGAPKEIFEELREKLLKHNANPCVKLNIEAQLRRAQILLSENNYDILNREWQEKVVYTLRCLDSINHRLEEGVSNITKDQPGLHVRGFASKADGSSQFYRLFIPSKCNPDTPLPLLVIVASRIVVKERPFIEGPTIANHQEALLWAKYAEKHGFAVIWPGYKNSPEGYTYESVHIEEAIQAVEADYNIDKHRISVFGTCAAGYNAGRLVSEYNNRFAAIVYDRAVFDRSLRKIESSPSLMTWYNTINPSRHVIENRHLKIFVMHDSTKGPGHGEMALTTQFLKQAKETRDDVTSYLSNQSMGIARMDMTFSWLASCINENPNNKRSHLLARAGFIGPISEVFATPILVVEGTHGDDSDLRSLQRVIESLRVGYMRHFHGAECRLKKDHDVSHDDIKNHTLVLVGNSQSNSIWKYLTTCISLKTWSSKILYNNHPLAGNHAFAVVERHPYATDKYLLMLGANDLRHLPQIARTNLFNAWYDGLVYTSPHKIISKLDALHTTTSEFEKSDDEAIESAQ